MNIKNLKYFIGKPCTIFTTPINRNFKEENPATFPKQLYIYFVGIISDIDEDGVWMNQLQNNLKSYWRWEQIIGISEEQVLDPQKDAAEIKKLKNIKN